MGAKQEGVRGHNYVLSVYTNIGRGGGKRIGARPSQGEAQTGTYKFSTITQLLYDPAIKISPTKSRDQYIGLIAFRLKKIPNLLTNDHRRRGEQRQQRPNRRLRPNQKKSQEERYVLTAATRLSLLVYTAEADIYCSC